MKKNIIIASLIGTFLVRTKPNASMNSLLWSFRIGIFGAALLTLIGGAIAGSQSFLDVPFELIYILITGLVVGQVIGTATEPVKMIENRIKSYKKVIHANKMLLILGGIVDDDAG